MDGTCRRRRQATHVANELGNRVTDYRPWYHIVRRLRPTIVFWATLIVCLIILNWRQVLATGRLPDSHIGFDAFIAILYVIAPILTLIVIAVLYLDRSWNWL